jgi:hypothetical protein
MNSSVLRFFFVLVLVLVLVACGSHGDFDRDRFETIVATVRARSLAPGHYAFKLNAALDPASLGPDDPVHGRGDGRGRLRVLVTADRKLALSIETEDHGHAGERGFMYVDSGVPEAALEDAVRLDSQHEERIDARWVRWSYDLD